MFFILNFFVLVFIYESVILVDFCIIFLSCLVSLILGCFDLNYEILICNVVLLIDVKVKLLIELICGCIFFLDLLIFGVFNNLGMLFWFIINLLIFLLEIIFVIILWVILFKFFFNDLILVLVV